MNLQMMQQIICLSLENRSPVPEIENATRSTKMHKRESSANVISPIQGTLVQKQEEFCDDIMSDVRVGLRTGQTPLWTS